MVDLAKISSMAPFVLNEDVKPPSRNQIRKDLEQALAVLREAGWAQGHYRTANGNVCAMGAVSQALTTENSRWAQIRDMEGRYYAARCVMQQTAEQLTGKPDMPPERFNDYIATSVLDVEVLFEKAIADL